MPAKGTTDPTSLPTRILTWLTDNPGGHRARDVANGLGKPETYKQADWSFTVARALGRMHRDGIVARDDRDIGHRKPVGHYLAADLTDAPTGDQTA